MSEDAKLAIDEADRAARYQAVKAQARDEMQQEVARQPHRSDDRQQANTTAIGDHFKEKAVTELVDTETEIERGRVAARVSQVVDYIFYLIYSLIGLEILLELLGARESSGFKRLIDAATYPLLMPFQKLMPDVGSGRFEFKISYVFALFVYVLLHLALNGLLRMLAHRKTQI